MTLDEIRAIVEQQRKERKIFWENIEKQQYENVIKKDDLIIGQYYEGTCRNATIARWDGTYFLHWRTKFGFKFVEIIKHFEDEQYYDVFIPKNIYELKIGDDEIPFDIVAQ